MSATIVLQAEYLHNNTGNHDKIYNVAIREVWHTGSKDEDSSHYEVIAEWGAREGVLRTQIKYSGISILAARLHFNSLINYKTRSKGYKAVSQSASSKTSLTNIPEQSTKPQKSPVKKQKLIEEPPVRQLDIDL